MGWQGRRQWGQLLAQTALKPKDLGDSVFGPGPDALILVVSRYTESSRKAGGSSFKQVGVRKCDLSLKTCKGKIKVQTVFVAAVALEGKLCAPATSQDIIQRFLTKGPRLAFPFPTIWAAVSPSC